MVKKLLKYEFAEYFKKLFPIGIVILGISVVLRIMYFFETDTTVFSISAGSMIIAFAGASIAGIILTFVFGVIRFYRNLYSNEGYLSMSLPVTATQHIVSKVIAATCMMLIMFVTIFVGLMIATSGEVLVELFKSFGFVIKKFYEVFGAHLIAYICYAVIAVILWIACSYMLFYTCLTIGQKANRAKVGLAVGVFFIYYFSVQFIETILLIIGTFIGWPFFDDLLLTMARHPIPSIHICAAVLIVLEIAYWFITYAITRRIMTKKLNLE